MPDLRQQLRCIRDEAVDFFAHVSAIAGPYSRYPGQSLTPDDRARGESIRRNLARIMGEMLSVIQGSRLLRPTTVSSHQRNTRRMVSALGFKRYECWDQQIFENEDTLIRGREAGESEEDISVGEAEVIFRQAFDETIVLLDLAEPMKTDTGAVPASGQKPITRLHRGVAEVVARVAPGGGPDLSAATWDAIEISFLSEERVEIRIGPKIETCNYSELGFEDRRNGTPNLAWKTLWLLAGQNGIIKDFATAGRDQSRVEKRIQDIRKALRKHFGISADPIPFLRDTGYQARFKIGRRPSSDA